MAMPQCLSKMKTVKIMKIIQSGQISCWMNLDLPLSMETEQSASLHPCLETDLFTDVSVKYSNPQLWLESLGTEP